MKQDWEIYRDTGILGAYRPEQVILRRSEDGGVETLFRDSTAKWEGDDLTRQRAMLVGGKCFLVTSVSRFSELKKHKEKGLERIFVSVLAEFIANRKKVAGRHSLQSHHQTHAVPTGATDSSHRQRTTHSTYSRQYCSR